MKENIHAAKGAFAEDVYNYVITNPNFDDAHAEVICVVGSH